MHENLDGIIELDGPQKVVVIKQAKEQFELSTGGGKVRSVIDKRTPV